jgi:hypothetical protein
MLIAVRTVSETDAIRTIEGLAYPFKGRDTYGTFFSARTDFHWGLFPDTDPVAARSDEDPGFIRPMTFHHGFDPDFGLDVDGVRVGGWSPVRMDADGVWVRSQIDKRHAYYESRLRPLLDAGALGLSGGSAEHSVRIDQKSGEVLDWPAYELALTPVESNPLAVIAARAAEIASTIRIVEHFVGNDGDSPAGDSPAVRGIQTFADIQAAAVMSDELPEAFDTLESAIYSAIYATDADFNPETPEAKQTAIGTSLEQFRVFVLSILDTAAATPRAGTRATRAGRRNSASDETSLATAHDNIASVLGMDCAPGDASARSAEDLPALRFVAEPERPDVELAAMATRAAETAAAEAVRRLTG